MRSLELYNGQAVSLSTCSLTSFEEFREMIATVVDRRAHLSALFCTPSGGGFKLYAVISDPIGAKLQLLASDIGKDYPSLTPDCPQAHWFEREIFEQWAVTPIGHPWLKPVRFERSHRGGVAASVGSADFFAMRGDDVHEVAVGPVHAGVIEPGHFRFQCHGETVYHLEISLGYQHRGVEKALVGGPNLRTRHYMETLAGDTSIAHTLAYCRIVEALTRTNVPPASLCVRAIAEELERLANHVGDIGALAGDVGFLPTQNYCGRIRGDILNLTAELCGNRFGRGLIVPGGVAHKIESASAEVLMERLGDIMRDVEVAVSLMFSSPSVMARLEGVGIVAAETASAIGLVGVAARASGLELDIRHQYPYGAYQFSSVPIVTQSTGDCFARAYVRWLEIKQSGRFIKEQLSLIGNGDIAVSCAGLPPGTLVVSLVEGWRGEICHVAATDESGHFAFYKIVDPSFHNWFGLAVAMRNQQISDFPLCNKSFNLSYCGHDL